MSDTARTVTVRINQQQRELLDRLRAEGTQGDTIAEVLRRVMRAHAAAVREGRA